ncbi:MAG: DnaD domain protein [Brotaphodocola sp.]
MDVTCSFQVSVTVIANDFIDRYMAAANGEYVKVYLYILRHQNENLEISTIADALNHTEADVRRALSYWEKLGALRMGMTAQDSGAVLQPRDLSVPEASGKGSANVLPAAKTADSRPIYSQDKVNLLVNDPEFKQLLYIAQQYMKKQFTPRESEVFAYLYDGLHMSAELLEYLVEYCVQGGHTSIRYIETVALNWHEKGLKDVESAKSYVSGFSKNSFAVMRAFGLTNRRPGDIEKEYIERWFLTYGFTKELVLEACNRTLKATQSPSFSYAEKILSEWLKAGVKNLRDVTALDQKRNVSQQHSTKKPTNQFHNFEQRNTNYDSMVMDQLKSWMNES